MLIGAIYSVIVAVWLARYGSRVWRGTAPLPSVRYPTVPFKAFMAALDRSMYAMAAFHGFMALMFLDAAFVAPHLRPNETAVPKPLLAMLVLFPLVGMLVSVGLHLCIGWFNVPRALVPPHLREVPDSVTSRRARCKGSA